MTVSSDSDWWKYENLPSGEPYDWGAEGDAARGDSPHDNLDFHLDLGCGRLPKARLGIDRFWAPGFPMMLMDLDAMVPATELGLPTEAEPTLMRTIDRFNEMALDGADLATSARPFLAGLPFPDNSIKSIISHHFMEHVGDGFIGLMDECHRVLEPGGILRIIVPLFPSRTAVEDPDHRRYFMEGTFETFCGDPEGNHWHESFATPYTSCRFVEVDRDMSPLPADGDPWHGEGSAREMRVALRKQGAS